MAHHPRGGRRVVIPSAFQYERASSIDDALIKLKAAAGAGKLIAGGHSLVPLMKLRLSEPTVLIDIARIQDLSGVVGRDDVVEIGALTTHHDVATSTLLREKCPALAETAALIGDPQVRNRGTLGGSLAHADPAADYPAMMLALEADIHLIGPSGSRVVRAADFFQGVLTVDLTPEEILTRVTFTPNQIAAYAKLQQRASRFALVGVAVVLDITEGKIRSARVALTGAASTPQRLSRVEEALTGQVASAESFASVAASAADGVEDVNDDLHGSEEYRRAMIRVFTERALVEAAARKSV